MKFIRILTLIVGFISSLQLLKAQEDALLWRVSGKGIVKPSYIFGTIHAICEEDMEISDTLLHKFNSTEQLVMEIDMNDPALMLKYQQGKVMKNGQTLDELMSEEEYNLLKNFMRDSLNIPIALMNNFKPFFIGMMYFSKFLECNPQAYDLKFVKMARERNIEIAGLESIESQFEIFEKIPLEEQVDNLLQQTIHFDEAKKEYLNIIRLYKNEQIQELLDLVKESALNKYQSELLINRNQLWIPAIEKMAGEKPSFFAVGAAHLAGEKGIINLLQENGYTIEPVK